MNSHNSQSANDCGKRESQHDQPDECSSSRSSNSVTSYRQDPSTPLLRKIKNIFTFQREITVEPILFLFNVASQIVWVTAQDLMVQKACQVNCGYSEWVCNDLSAYESEEVAVQTLVSNLIMWRSILEASIKIVSVPLLGWWGDKWGRKGPLILCLSALGLESTWLLINCLASSWPLEAILFGAFFYGVSGGTHALLMLSFSFMAERTSNKERTLRMGILDGFYYLGSPVGLAIGPPLLRSLGYEGVFGTSITIYAVSVLYVIVRIPKGVSNGQNGEEEERQTNCSDCGVDHLTDAFYTTFKRRSENARKYILICILAMLLDSFSVWGESIVKYLFTRRALDWDYTKYSHYASLSSFLVVVGALVIVPAITSSTSLKDTLIGLIGASSRCAERVFYALATNPSRSWLMYVGSVFGTGSPLAPIAIRSQISKLAYEDVGQVYAVMAVGETLLPFASAPIYNGIYEATVDGYPGAFYLFSLILNVFMGLCFIYLFISMKLQKRKRQSDQTVSN